MNILEKIVLAKQQEVAEAKALRPVSALERLPLFERKPYSLRGSLQAADASGIIAEFKRRSPSKGLLREQAVVGEIVPAYAAAGASGVSVLSDMQFFGALAHDFAEARSLMQLPLLRKDFMIEEYQIIESKAMGADVILLIAACLLPAQVRRLAALAKSLQMEVLLEVHNAQELEQHLCEEVDIVGVNNRNLKSFEVSIENSLALAEKIPADFVKISESGLQQVADIQALRAVGYQGFLIGETFMKAEQPGQALADLVAALSSPKIA